MKGVLSHPVKNPYQENGVQAKGFYEGRYKENGEKVQGPRFKVQGGRRNDGVQKN
jgi:hypothetical protein